MTKTINWVEVNLPWSSGWTDDPSFMSRDLNNPGVLIELADGRQFLIGDINEISGVCDDCCAFQGSQIVKRYAVVWEKG